MPFRLEEGRTIREKRSPISKRRKLVYSVNRDLSRKSKTLKGKFAERPGFAHVGDYSSKKKIPVGPYKYTYKCPFCFKIHRVREGTRNPIRCPNTGKKIGYI